VGRNPNSALSLLELIALRRVGSGVVAGISDSNRALLTEMGLVQREGIAGLMLTALGRHRLERTRGHLSATDHDPERL
jgi:hypothetical protein